MENRIDEHLHFLNRALEANSKMQSVYELVRQSPKQLRAMFMKDLYTLLTTNRAYAECFKKKLQRPDQAEEMKVRIKPSRSAPHSIILNPCLTVPSDIRRMHMRFVQKMMPKIAKYMAHQSIYQSIQALVRLQLKRVDQILKGLLPQEACSLQVINYAIRDILAENVILEEQILEGLVSTGYLISKEQFYYLNGLGVEQPDNFERTASQASVIMPLNPIPVNAVPKNIRRKFKRQKQRIQIGETRANDIHFKQMEKRFLTVIKEIAAVVQKNETHQQFTQIEANDQIMTSQGVQTADQLQTFSSSFHSQDRRLHSVSSRGSNSKIGKSLVFQDSMREQSEGSNNSLNKLKKKKSAKLVNLKKTQAVDDGQVYSQTFLKQIKKALSKSGKSFQPQLIAKQICIVFDVDSSSSFQSSNSRPCSINSRERSSREHRLQVQIQSTAKVENQQKFGRLIKLCEMTTTKYMMKSFQKAKTCDSSLMSISINSQIRSPSPFQGSRYRLGLGIESRQLPRKSVLRFTAKDTKL